MAATPRLGVCFPRELEPGLVVEFAERLETGGVDELWLIEDCFFTAGITLAATALAHSERLTVGIGILPAVTRNAATTAMELATLARLAPGRVVGGLGHGVRAWMEQIGARPASPVTALAEVITAVRSLLAGETVTMHGTTVELREVQLDAAPSPPPPVLAGVRRPKSLAVAGRHADGIILTELTGPSVVRDSIATAAAAGPFDVVVYTVVSIDTDRHAARRAIAPFIAENLAHGLNFGLNSVPFFADLVALLERDGVDGLATAPDEWWIELGAIGTPDDVAAHVGALADAGATTVAFFPSPVADVALTQIDKVVHHVVGSV
jgi:alkanesulfonate monooxygenase SsuD/methylene tetrahydromethanopterin reductase-like flavin-dependent oxidoreductase (luciferase family)